MIPLVRSSLDLPFRPAKPRRTGITMVIDNGLPTAAFRDHVASTAELIDVVKFGWGTVVATPDIGPKIAALEEHGIDFFFGGTLFEKHVLQDRFDEYRAFCRAWGCRVVEVSNGTVALGNEEKAAYVGKLSGEFTVFSEVGLKDTARSERMAAWDWVEYIRQDLDAGASLVIAEARESGRSGICHADGKLRSDVLDAILGSGVDVERLLFEAPTKDLQASFIRRIGPNVNLGNVAPGDVIGVETLRLGLRSDTLTAALPPVVPRMAAARAAHPNGNGRHLAAAPDF
jgi:phosphosulfolactate synthase